MSFQKGNNLGLKFKKGNCANPNGRPKGIPHTEKWKIEQSIKKIGMKYRPMSEIGKKNISIAHMGQKGFWTGKKKEPHSEEAKKKMSLAHSGEKAWNWRGGYKRRLINNANRRALRKNAIGSYTLGEWELLKKQYGYVCPCCKRSEPEIKLTIDHIISLSKGGSNWIENIQPLCLSCNCRKQTKIIKY